MIKVVGLFKKRIGISDDEFREYYENHHCPLFHDHLSKPGVERWVRRYLKPITAPVTSETRGSRFDAIAEVWCTEEWFNSFFVDPLPESFRAMVSEDEAKLFNLDEMYMFAVDEVDTDLTILRQARAR